MQVSRAIELLQKYYKPEDNIIMAWWDKEWADATQDTPLSDELWESIAEQGDDILEGAGDSFYYSLTSAIEHEKELI